jgi:hypothetical protein
VLGSAFQLTLSLILTIWWEVNGLFDFYIFKQSLVRGKHTFISDRGDENLRKEMENFSLPVLKKKL